MSVTCESDYNLNMRSWLVLVGSPFFSSGGHDVLNCGYENTRAFAMNFVSQSDWSIQKRCCYFFVLSLPELVCYSEAERKEKG